MDKYEECKKETIQHIENVRQLTRSLSERIKRVGELHDASKLVFPEIDYFAEHTPALATTTYGTKEYEAHKLAMKPALDHHYANNRHHPEHFPNGISGMNLVDIVEMLCDWKASSMRHLDGNILKSIEINAKRFNISEDLAAILRNTAELLEL